MPQLERRRWYTETHVRNWGELCHVFWDERGEGEGRPIYRGESSAKWKLNPGLLRSPEAFAGEDPYDYERGRLWLFKADAARRHVCASSAMGDLEWLALLQHHGGWTRLLDWTRSPFIATWFAVRDSFSTAKAPAPFVIWKLRSSRLTERALELACQAGIACDAGPEFQSPGAFHRLFMQRSVPLIAPVIPSVWNRRIAVQQGLFLCSSEGVADYRATLKKMFHGEAPPFTRIVVDGRVRLEAVARLENMNIHAGVLIPGLAGLTEHLKTLRSRRDMASTSRRR